MGKIIEMTFGDPVQTATFEIEDDLEPHLNWEVSEDKTKSQAEVFASFGSQLGYSKSSEILAVPEFAKKWKEIVLHQGTPQEERFMSVRDLMDAMGSQLRKRQNEHTQQIMRDADADPTDDMLDLSIRLKADCEAAGLTGIAIKLGESIGVVKADVLFGLNGTAMKLLAADRARKQPKGTGSTTSSTTTGAATTEPTTEAEKPPF